MSVPPPPATSPRRVAIVAIGVEEDMEHLRPLIALARALIYQSSTVCELVTHAKYEHILHEQGIGFVDAGPCPFAARTATSEGRVLSAGGINRSNDNASSSS